MNIPKGNTREERKVRKQIIGDFYAKWIADHPDKKVWNKSLNAYIHVKFHSINETKGQASGTYESTEAVVVKTKPKKQEDKNQKRFSKMVVMKYGSIKLTVGLQKTTKEYVQYCITVPGIRKK